ncbi:cytochrome c [Rhizobium oryzicola]|uniref:Cytochrome c n=1 Tax=Rhizobium oryzicola TaxID=1232668 RepID=A0ABT8T360_9HYPH|nr:cytochrome c [Rhizobium oryzicola]MDO1584854.1 cytochrome c [Rhizobium oryzicola]
MIVVKSKRQIWLSALGIAGLVGMVTAAIIVYEPAIPPVARPSPSSFEVAEVKRGAELASIGDCVVCHSTDGGRPFAGSKALPTPFGTLYSDNITPDETTGIGNWSFAAFQRAMTRGVARDGSHLYPALPYEHFTHVDDADLQAIYAFLMTREPVKEVQPPNDLLPGLGFRPLLAGWKFLFLRKTAFVQDKTQNNEWNRGKYLVEGLGHCGGCHTPRNLLGAEEHGSDLAGGVAEGWIAPALDASNPSASRWDQASLFDYLKNGIAGAHSAAGGPMGPVAEGLSEVDDADVRAISTYIASRMKPAATPSAKTNANPAKAEGTTASKAATRTPASDAAKLFAGACGGCHMSGAPMETAGRPPLSVVSDLKMDDPRNAIKVVLGGITPAAGHGPYMPGFADALTDQQIADLLAYARSRFTDAPTWPDLAAKVSVIRKEDAK